MGAVGVPDDRCRPCTRFEPASLTRRKYGVLNGAATAGATGPSCHSNEKCR
jgi:hypothetical protein